MYRYKPVVVYPFCNGLTAKVHAWQSQKALTKTPAIIFKKAFLLLQPPPAYAGAQQNANVKYITFENRDQQLQLQPQPFKRADARTPRMWAKWNCETINEIASILADRF